MKDDLGDGLAPALRAFMVAHVRKSLVGLIVLCRRYRIEFDEVLATAKHNTEGYEP